jgi:ribonuclease VapC
MIAVLDSSAILAFVQNEPGSDVVEAVLIDGACCGAANWSEVAQKVLAAQRDWGLVRALLLSYSIRVEPIHGDDAEWAARRWRARDGLSLADRLCLALGARLEVDILTADTQWGSTGGIIQIR